LRRSARLRERAQAQPQSVPSDQAPIVTASSEQAHSSQQTTSDGALSELPTSQQQDNGDQNQAEVELDIADDVSVVGHPDPLTSSVNMPNYDTMPEINDNIITSELLKDTIQTPEITEADYINDDDFVDMYLFLRHGQLTGVDERDRKPLLMADHYYLEGFYLYKASPPRGRKQGRLRPILYQLCIPRKFRNHILSQFHQLLGHYSYGRLYPSISATYFWPNLCSDIKEFVRTCPVCQRTKIPTNKPVSPLYPLQIPRKPFEFVAMDFKKLTRRTNAGNQYVLVIICHFSSYVIYSPTPDETAYTVAKTFMRDAISRFGNIKAVFSDRGSCFMSQFFSHIATMLGITQYTYVVRRVEPT